MLDRIESRLQAALESRLPWIKNRHSTNSLAQQLVDALYEKAKTSPDGQAVAPDDFIVYMHPERAAAWNRQTDLLDDLLAAIQNAADEEKYKFLQPPTLRVLSDSSLKTDAYKISADYKPSPLEQTASMPVEQPAGDSGPLPKNAFLIVDGNRVFPLRQPVINIGRRADNHLTIDDPRVSRSHAQIRVTNGSYILFDLNSTGGTYVNNERITRYSLQPGDVISLAGVTLVYGEDAPTGPQKAEGSTSPLFT
ncbi:MAG TPA: DUF3662 domain-containing protein [Chloroflexi bacterium]|nr:DUF3662 domain-containing protein [Chloroflexota bacterium]